MAGSFLDLNKTAYDSKYEKGYGVMYPEGHIIRIYEHFLKHELGIIGGKKLFDFGCGNGTHALYFDSKGFDVYGTDISAQAIDICRKRMPQKGDHFKVVKVDEGAQGIFKGTFDIILANQVLYFLTDTVMQNTLKQFNEILNPDGIVILTMMGTQNYFFKFAGDKNSEGLRKVALSGRINDITYINFVNDEADLLAKFKLFKPYFVGYYDFLAREGSSFHYIFLGRK